MSEPKNHTFAVIFTSQRTSADRTGYEAMAERMVSLAKTQPGFLGVDSVRGEDGVGITVSYWESLESIRRWKENAEHLVAQKTGKERWYSGYTIRVCRVEREYGFVARGSP